jgi:glycosyltransferase involved in cell wall biosynthesis
MALGPIVLTTRTLGSTTGVSQVALDIALALSQRSCELRVRSWVPKRLPQQLDGHALGRWVLEPVSPLKAARALWQREAPPRALLEHARGAGRGLGREPVVRPAPVLEVVNGLGAHALWQAAVRVPHVPNLLVVHESPRHFNDSGRMDLQAALAALRCYDSWVFVSERGQKEWEALAGLDPSRTYYVPNCVKEQRVEAMFTHARTELRKRMGYDATDAVRAVCVGQVCPRKGQDVLLAGLSAMPDSGAPIHLDFLGDCSSRWARRLKRETQSSALAGRVRFVGKVSDVYDRVYAADLLLLGSRAEASPLVVLEAMALGTCVLAADVDGVSEQIVDEETGLLFHHGTRELGGSLSRLGRDPALRERLARGGRVRYLERYSRERQLARWSAILSEVLSTPPP